MKAQIVGLDGNARDIKGLFNDSLPMAQVGGKYFDWVRKGYVFTGFTATPLSILAYTSATNVPSLWNPDDSGKIVVPLILKATPSAEGTVVIHSLGINYKVNCGSHVGTAAPYSVFTEVAAVNNLIGGGVQQKAKWSPATNTLTAVGTLFDLTSIGLWVDGTPAVSGPVTGFKFEFDALILKPGSAIQIVSTPAASSTTYSVALTWAELPYDPKEFA